VKAVVELGFDRKDFHKKMYEEIFSFLNKPMGTA